jgi:hypothetical protein
MSPYSVTAQKNVINLIFITDYISGSHIPTVSISSGFSTQSGWYKKKHVYSTFPLISMIEAQQEGTVFATITRKLGKQGGFARRVALTSTQEHVIQGIPY